MCSCGCNTPKNNKIRELTELRRYQELIEDLHDTLSSLSAHERHLNGLSCDVAHVFDYGDILDTAYQTVLLELHEREKWLEFENKLEPPPCPV